MRNPYLCLTIVYFLGIGALVGVVCITAMNWSGHSAPEALLSTVSFCFGSLSSFLVKPPIGSKGAGVDAEEGVNP